MPQLVRCQSVQARLDRRRIEHVPAKVPVPQHPAARPREHEVLRTLASLEDVQLVDEEPGIGTDLRWWFFGSPQTSFPSGSVTDSATLILRRIVSGPGTWRHLRDQLAETHPWTSSTDTRLGTHVSGHRCATRDGWRWTNYDRSAMSRRLNRRWNSG